MSELAAVGTGKTEGAQKRYSGRAAMSTLLKARHDHGGVIVGIKVWIHADSDESL